MMGEKEGKREGKKDGKDKKGRGYGGGGEVKGERGTRKREN